MITTRMKYLLLVSWLVLLALIILILAYFALVSPDEAVQLLQNGTTETEEGNSFIELFFSILPYVLLK